MKKLLGVPVSIIFSMVTICTAQSPLSLKYQHNQTPTYEEVIAGYQFMDEQYSDAVLLEAGTTDSGRPLHLFVMTRGAGENKSLQNLAKDRTVLLINNGIHPGESSGIDASIEYCHKMLQQGIPEQLLIAVIPVYNVGGALNRGQYHRVNQKGPVYHGFRGNARNLDLNRDFIKADALNTRSFYAIFHAIQPHIFVDTHTSNGADYQYTISLISTQKDKLNPVLAGYMTNEIEPYLYRTMKDESWEMIPYVNVFGRVPDDGFSAFLETPRFASGYTALFNCIGFITETHMLKSYEDRVSATFSFLEVLTRFMEANATKIHAMRSIAEASDSRMNTMAINWVLDSAQVKQLEFKGYEHRYEESRLGAYKRLRYLGDNPKTMQVPYYSHYKATDSVRIPAYYVVPQAWREVVQLLQYNQVKMKRILQDTLIEAVISYIDQYEFPDGAYEGHHPIPEVITRDTILLKSYLKGDFLVPLNQSGRRFIISVLEPRAVDSYLRWNFFDAIFQQKEYFSAYVFEDTAEQLLEQNPALRRDFEAWKTNNPNQAKSPYSVLGFIYKRSPYYERSHLQYPVGRIF